MNTVDRMRTEWNGRAQRDANFYAAFRRRNQANEDFLASAAEVIPMFEIEFPRLQGDPSERRALEIGCGPGRLLVAMRPHFGAIDGVDISDEMVVLARERLRDASNARVHLTSGADLNMFPDATFDFVYSYAVFQHIPDREIVLNYLREAHRVLKPGGVLCCQIRGVPALPSNMSSDSDTWTGCYFSTAEIAQFAREQSFPLVAISGIGTLCMWTTFRKAPAQASAYSPERVVVKAVTAISSGEPRVPGRGPEAAVSLWIDGMPQSASLADCPVLFGVREELGCYLSPISESGGCQLNVRIPDGIVPGEYETRLKVSGSPLPKAHQVTILPSTPWSPRVLSVTDGVNLSSRYRLETNAAKVVIEDVADPGEFLFHIAGRPVAAIQYECIEPITSTWEFSFSLTPKMPRGNQSLDVQVKGSQLAAIPLEILNP